MTATEGLDEKYRNLENFIRGKGRHGVVVAFSGGVDSSTLAAICQRVLGKKAIAVTAKSPTYTTQELETAKETAKEIGIKHRIVETDELSNEKYCENPENRCYYCKKELLQHLQRIAGKLGYRAVFEGTNFSDLGEHRPGFEAVKEMKSVYSPWVETEFTKTEIRTLSKKLGLSVYDRLAQPCLATRIPYHERITKEKLTRVAEAEKVIKEITGVNQLRVRDHNGLARIEVGKEERKLFFKVEYLDKIADSLTKLGFKYATFDLEGYRSGSMLKTLDT
ncbi:MAG TPA: ATP-dependent sacrificial sulfur transferase LarE [candidate division Zixibacteria bacterium]|nr:ATP-dependent sacrificial sulfur transferase LarE [candidate division Zixibacteria bacterium]